uniref:ATP synthase complex subunit 8 n=1 Tax=Pseudocalotes microlepis TaxID=1963763 RepID=A0A384TYF1_9SAUR|nr:ATP synthase F0 subunit 8 [Pseudocalotes microlepis]AQU64358.1 ATP synthase F0 subunit 8 [Pseudocalotes microlepis]QGN67001.1 ATP synthase F0 subunit 8 [Pseudocalotes microlepis]
MPQLNPTPWFTVMLITWLFLLIMMTKVLNSNQTANPTTQNLKTAKTPWTWTWH